MILAISALGLWAVGWFLLPVTLWRRDLRGNARNWPGLIVVRRGLDCPGAVWAQEYYEARRGWRWLPVSLPMLMLGRFVPRLDAWRRRQELMGHEIEVWAETRLTGADAQDVRRREAVALTRYACFARWSDGEIETAMRDRAGAAGRFVQRHWAEIQQKDYET